MWCGHPGSAARHDVRAAACHVRLLQVGLGLFSSEQFCRGDSESQLWQKAMSRPHLLDRKQCTKVVVMPLAFQSRFQKLGQGGI